MGWLLLVPSVAIGADILVGPQQTYATIQAGIDAASPADRVLVDPGTYDEILSILKSLAATKPSIGVSVAEPYELSCQRYTHRPGLLPVRSFFPS